jgi:WD40 repeat protein
VNPLKPLHVATTDRQIVCARFSPDGAVLAAGAIDGTVRRWRVGEKQLDAMPLINGHHGWVSAVAFHPKAPWMFTADTWGQLRCQNFADDAPQTLWQSDAAHDGWLRQIAVSIDGRHLATCGRDQVVRVWTPDGKPVAEHRHSEDVFAIVFSPDGQQVVFGDHHGHLHVWDFASQKIIRTFDAAVFFKTDRIQDIAGLRVLRFFADGKLLLAAGTTPEKGATIQSTPTLLAFDFATGELRHKFIHGAVKDGFIEDLVVHPAGYLMAVTSGDPGNGKLFMFRPDEKEAFDSATQLPNCHAIALHPDARRFVVASTNRDSNGNGRRTDKEGSYPCNTSPLSLFELPASA